MFVWIVPIHMKHIYNLDKKGISNKNSNALKSEHLFIIVIVL